MHQLTDMTSHFQFAGHVVISHRKMCHLVSEREASTSAHAAAFCQFLI